MPIRANTTQLVARPVVFCDSRIISESLEWNDLIKCNRDATKALQKLQSVAGAIAKSMGALGVVEYSSDSRNNITVIAPGNPAYDITKEAIDRLNKEYLAERGAASHNEIKSPQLMLYKAILSNSPEKIKMAVKAGANVNLNEDGKTPLVFSILLRASKAVEALLECGAKANQDLVHQAVSKNDIKSAVLLAKKCGIDINNAVYEGRYSQKATLMQHAIQEQDIEATLSLVQSGIALADNYIVGQLHCMLGNNFSAGGKRAETALQLFKEMINHGFNVNDLWEYVDFHCESSIGLKFLIENGANPNYSIQSDDLKNYSTTPLILAIQSGNLKNINFILNAGANINQKANPSAKVAQTPFSVAVSGAQHPHACPGSSSICTGVIEFLLERGATL